MPPGGESHGAIGAPGSDPFVLSGGELWQWNGAWGLISNQVPNLTAACVGITPAQTPVVTGLGSAGATSYELVNSTWLQRGGLRALIDNTTSDPLRGNLIAFAAGEMLVYTASPAAEVELGSGCGAPAPRLFGEGVPRLGSPGFRLHASDGQGAITLFAMDFASVATPLGGGCTQYLANPVAVGITTANPYGVASLDVPLPWGAAFRGLDLFVQAATPQVGAPLGGIAVSAALRLTLGD